MIRHTIQRTLVLKAVNNLQNHATADEIYEEIVKKHPDISRATVYRNLNKLSEEGLIRKCLIPGGADRFDHLCSDHYHIKCECCGRVFDVDMDYIPDLASGVHDTHGFTFKSHNILFSGICPDCRKKCK